MLSGKVLHGLVSVCARMCVAYSSGLLKGRPHRPSHAENKD